MDKQTALEILIANACCGNRLLSCEECPCYDPDQEDFEQNGCFNYSESETAEAVRVLKGGGADNG